MIRLSGLIPDRDIKIIYTGVRKGEKLSEKLFTTTEKLDVTKDSKIFMSTKGSSFENLDDILSKVNMLIDKILDKDVKIKLKKLLYENNNNLILSIFVGIIFLSHHF